MNDIEVSRYDSDVTVVTLNGEHDLSTKKEVEATLESLVRANNRVIVNLSVAKFIDSTILNTLLLADRLASENGRRLTLEIGSEPVVEKILRVSGLLSRLPNASTRAQAIELACNGKGVL